MRHGVIATAVQLDVESYCVSECITFFSVTPQWWAELEVLCGISVRAGDVPALRGSDMVKGPADSAVMASFCIC